MKKGINFKDYMKLKNKIEFPKGILLSEAVQIMLLELKKEVA